MWIPQRTLDDAVEAPHSPWTEPNLWTRSMRDHVNEQARKGAEARSRADFLALADKFAEQERQTAAHAAEHGWR